MARKPEKEAAAAAGLSRREREVMDIVYRLGRATAAEIRGYQRALNDLGVHPRTIDVGIEPLLVIEPSKG